MYFNGTPSLPGMPPRKLMKEGAQSSHLTCAVNFSGLAVSVIVFDFCTDVSCDFWWQMRSTTSAIGNGVCEGSCPVLYWSFTHWTNTFTFFFIAGSNQTLPSAIVSSP